MNPLMPALLNGTVVWLTDCRSESAMTMVSTTPS